MHSCLLVFSVSMEFRGPRDPVRRKTQRRIQHQQTCVFGLGFGESRRTDSASYPYTTGLRQALRRPQGPVAHVWQSIHRSSNQSRNRHPKHHPSNQWPNVGVDDPVVRVVADVLTDGPSASERPTATDGNRRCLASGAWEAIRLVGCRRIWLACIYWLQDAAARLARFAWGDLVLLLVS